MIGRGMQENYLNYVSAHAIIKTARNTKKNASTQAGISISGKITVRMICHRARDARAPWRQFR